MEKPQTYYQKNRLVMLNRRKDFYANNKPFSQNTYLVYQIYALRKQRNIEEYKEPSLLKLSKIQLKNKIIEEQNLLTDWKAEQFKAFLANKMI